MSLHNVKKPLSQQGFPDRYNETAGHEVAMGVDIGVRSTWLRIAWCFVGIVTIGRATAEVGLTSQPQPLGYPGSLDDEADAAAEAAAGSMWPPPRRADEPQVPGGFDPYRSPNRITKPADLIAWHQEPTPASCCDRHLVDREWMGPGELAYHRSPHHRGCARDYTRVFRTEFPGRLWIAAEYLVWATAGQAVPPLVTSSPSGTATSQIGVLGSPTTTIRFGGNEFAGPMRSGARLTAGFWFTPRQERGIEASWFGLATAEDTLALSSTGGDPWLAIPYMNALTDQPSAIVIPGLTTVPADPALLEQSIDARLKTQFGSVDVLYRSNLTCGEDFHRRYLVGGFRYLMLDDEVVVDSAAFTSTGTPGGYPRTGSAASDSFRTLSQFYGGEFGMVEKWWRDRWSLQLLGKVALGASSIDTTITGSTTTTETTSIGGKDVTTITGSFPGGILAQPTNPGGQRSMFSALGEVGVTADYAIWSQFRVSVGYSLVYWSTVARAAAQIDDAVNPSQFAGGVLTGPAVPAFQLRTTGFWAQGVNAGLEYQF